VLGSNARPQNPQFSNNICSPPKEYCNLILFNDSHHTTSSILIGSYRLSLEFISLSTGHHQYTLGTIQRGHKAMIMDNFSDSPTNVFYMGLGYDQCVRVSLIFLYLFRIFPFYICVDILSVFFV